MRNEKSGKYVLYGDSLWNPVQDVAPTGEETLVYSPDLAPEVKLPEALYRAEPTDELFQQSQYRWAKLDKPIQRSALSTASDGRVVGSSV